MTDYLITDSGRVVEIEAPRDVNFPVYYRLLATELAKIIDEQFLIIEGRA